MKNPKFQIYTGANNQFRFRLQAANGKIILSSEGYATKAGCQNAVNSVKTNAPHAERYERKAATNAQFYFTLKAANGERIGQSELYTSAASRDQGIEAVKRVAPDAPVEDIV